MNKSTQALRLLKPTSKLVGLDIKAIRRYCSRREQLDSGETDVWSFVGRLPCSNNSIPSSNQKDVLKLRRGWRECEPQIKHFLDMKQTKLYERFRHEHNELNLGQRYFEKYKPWYFKIKTTHNTCCCRYHIEYAYYYDTYIHILRVLHNTLMQECSTTFPSTSSREFIHSILCRRTEGCTFYQMPFV